MSITATAEVEIVKNTDTSPWDCLSGEDMRSYEKFLFYRDLSLGSRSIPNAYFSWRSHDHKRKSEIYLQKHNKPYPKKLPGDKKTPGQWYRLAKRFNWTARAQAWDRWQLKEREHQTQLAVREEAIEWARRRSQMRQDAWKMRNQLLQQAEEMMRIPLVARKIENTEHSPDGTTIINQITFEPARWSRRDIATYLQVAQELGKEATGVVTDIEEAIMKLFDAGVLPDAAVSTTIDSWFEFREKIKAALQGDSDPPNERAIAPVNPI